MFNTIQEIIDDLAQGKMVIIVDDENRENEGDFLMVASKVRPQDINFMATHGRGLVCMTMRRERCKQLDLPLMVSETNDAHGTNFTLSIEAAEGVTTGISAYDRALTVRAAVAPDATPQSIVQPGHIFPIMAQPGGVLTRAGHTEAGCDLAALAGYEPSAVIVEILNEDGTMARRDDLVAIAEKHQLKMGTIEDLIRYRLDNETTVKRTFEKVVNTAYGKFKLIVYKDIATDAMHLALVKGEIDENDVVLTRVHIEDSVCDLLSLREPGSGWPLQDAMQKIEEEGKGVVVVLREPREKIDILKRLQKVTGMETDDSESSTDAPAELRTYGIGAQILLDLGVRKMCVMSAPMHLNGIAGFGLEVVEYRQE
ncbi:MAG: 3,4-dihydroxy-2-butanone-4-phosphate synthase [Proteobacteria bacterium]|nr:MAG: 3,4-dihydroxy-2-butanone-4-phosphate synthase [Pseudomonadota bacterium]